MASSKVLLRVSVIAAFALLFVNSPEGGESGPIIEYLIKRATNGELLLVSALVLSFVWPRVSALAGISAILFSWPLCVFYTMPKLFQRIYPGNYVYVPLHFFEFNLLPSLLSLSLLALAGISIFTLMSAPHKGHSINSAEDSASV